jgi:hypothetical protein
MYAISGLYISDVYKEREAQGFVLLDVWWVRKVDRFECLSSVPWENSFIPPPQMCPSAYVQKFIVKFWSVKIRHTFSWGINERHMKITFHYKVRFVSQHIYRFSVLKQQFNLRIYTLCRISGSHCGEYEDGCLLGCSAVESGRSLPTFQRYLLPPLSGTMIPDYMAQQPRRQPSSYSPPWETEIPLIIISETFHYRSSGFTQSYLNSQGVTTTKYYK